jgi:hypothetical protein
MPAARPRSARSPSATRTTNWLVTSLTALVTNLALALARSCLTS